MAVLGKMKLKLKAALACTRKVMLKSKRSNDQAGHCETNKGETPPGTPNPETHSPTGAPWGEELTSPTVETATSSTMLLDQTPLASTEDELPTETADDPTWVFNGEAEEDYTANTSKVVHANDGSKVCVGFLPSYTLSKRIQNAVRVHRKVKRVEVSIDKELDALDQALFVSNKELAQLERRIVEVQQSGTDDACPTLVDMRRNVSALQERRAAWIRSQDRINRHMDSMYATFRQDQDEFLTELDALLVMCALLPPDPADEGEPCASDCASAITESSDVTYPHMDDLDSLQSARCGSELTSAIPGKRSNGKQPVVVDDQKRELLYNFRTQQAILAHAEEALDNRYVTFDQEADVRDRKLAGGHSVETNTEAELRQCRDTQRLTRRIVEAEEALDEAKAALLLAGIQPYGSDVSSGFVDDVNDGYRLSLEVEMCHSVDSARVMKWLSTIPKPDCDAPRGEYEPEDTLVDTPESDDWDAKSVGGSDSGSMVAVGSQKKRIEKWKAICTTLLPHNTDTVAAEC